MRTVSLEDRRRALVRRHHLAGDAGTPEEVTRSLVALHATDPASVYLSVLARSPGTSFEDMHEDMYGRRSLVRWMAMRRTLFVFAREDVPMVQAAVSTPLAAALRRQLIARLERNGSEPPIEGGDIDAWVARVEERVERAMARRGSATGVELRRDEPALATLIPARAPSDRPQRVTAPLLTLMSAAGRLVRATPTGPWTSRHHRWEPLAHWWPDGMPAIDPPTAQRELARRWLTRFGPATFEDLQWWTGWTKGTTGAALDQLPTLPVDLHGREGIALDDDDSGTAEAYSTEPTAALLPALDPTPMGWKHRDWFLGIAAGHLFDTAGNIGPTLWWDGEIIGSWAVTSSGDVRTKVLADRGKAADQAIAQAAADLTRQLHGTAVTPAVRTPLERSLT